MTFKKQTKTCENCEHFYNLARVDTLIWQDSGYFYYVSFWYYWYGIQCQCIRRFCTYEAAMDFRDKLLKILNEKEQK